MHVHVACPDGEAKFWLEPLVTLAQNYGLSAKQVKDILAVIEEKKSELTSAWQKHFKGS